MSALRVEGEVREPLALDFEDLCAFADQVPDVGAVIAGKQGAGVRLGAVLDRAGLLPGATHLGLESSDGRFAASLPLEAARAGVLVYKLGAGPLPPAQGGPIRFYQGGPATCQGGEADACANVKFVALLRATAGPGRDTRPTTPDEHAALHPKPGHEHLG